MIALFFSFLFVAAVYAQRNFVAGTSRYISSDASVNADVQFSLDKVTDTVGAIIDTLFQGNNRTIDHVLPVKKIYGVNMGNWLLSEPWMSPGRWTAMQGQFCATGGCSTCRQSEWSLASYLGREQTNEIFQQHWQDWFKQEDVDGIVEAGLNTVRLPLPFWIIEDIVDTSHEPYAQGGLDELIRGLNMLKAAGLYVVLDHHALPGVSSRGQMFAGNCTNEIHFYDSPNDYNYKRAVTWSIVMAWLSHNHPSFETVFSIEAINEPEQNYALTPGLDRFEKSFVLGVRILELSLGLICDLSIPLDALLDPIARPALKAAVPIIHKLAKKYDLGLFGVDAMQKLGEGATVSSIIGGIFGGGHGRQRKCLSTQFMNRDWQYSQSASAPVPNPANAARGPQLYDNHLYFNFGGVADQNEQAYLTTICNLTRVESAAKIGNAPMYFGEWAISTAFDVDDVFLRKWGDAQKLAYSKGAGWMFWNWKVDPDAQVPQQKMWSYRDAVLTGVMPAKPDEYFDTNVCVPYHSA